MTMVSEIEIVIAIIVVIFSGIWSAIKWMDEQTDNKWVFLAPAGVLVWAIFMADGGFLFWVFLLALGPVVVMLTKVGLEQGKVPQKRSYSSFDRTAQRNPQPLNLNRELAPSYI